MEILAASELQVLREFTTEPTFLNRQDEFKHYRLLHSLADGGYLEYEEDKPLTREVTGRCWKLSHRGAMVLRKAK